MHCSPRGCRVGHAQRLDWAELRSGVTGRCRKGDGGQGQAREGGPKGAGPTAEPKPVLSRLPGSGAGTNPILLKGQE